MKKIKWTFIVLILMLTLGFIFGNRDLTLNIGDTYYVFNLFKVLILLTIIASILYLTIKVVGRGLRRNK